MDKEKLDQLVKEMTGLCKQGTHSAILISNSPVGKVLFTAVIAAIIGSDSNPHIEFWWKPPDPWQ